jgi:hypothetical protein
MRAAGLLLLLQLLSQRTTSAKGMDDLLASWQEKHSCHHERGKRRRNESGFKTRTDGFGGQLVIEKRFSPTGTQLDDVT